MMKNKGLTDEERLDWIRLFRSENVGPITFRRLLARFGSAEAALLALPDLARCGGAKRPIAIASPAAAAHEQDAVVRLGGRIIALPDADYPPLLRAISDAPPVLIVLGNVALLHTRCVAIVGARNASTNGNRLAFGLSRDLATKGITV
ncbi:MAG: DNA-processing protein DprA, partial [Rhodospirillaceae bacterium]|nr:DNA-processing protein DprA [Rhodospirillaceae bacterium]